MDLCKPCRGNNWKEMPLDLVGLKKIFARWQYALEGKGWNTLYWENHDQVRSVSRFGNDSKEWCVKSAKMLAVCLHGMKGTPYIFMGEELGMVNMPFETIDDYRDIASHNDYNEMLERGLSKEEALHILHLISRDNSRTPMQWTTEKNAGFTTGSPWIKVNPSYKEVNVALQENDKDSVLSFYKKLIALRHTCKTLVYGRFDLLLKDSKEIFAYTRTLDEEEKQSKLLVACNFTDKTVEFSESGQFKGENVLISNYEDSSAGNSSLRPYEAFIIKR